MTIDEMLKNEVKFLEEQEAVKTDKGVYFYQSGNGVHMMRLDAFLCEYKDWLIENKIVKPIEK